MRNTTLYTAPVSVSSSGANQIVAADATRQIQVVHYTLVADAAVTAKWQSGGTDLCGGLSLAANGGVSSPFVKPGDGWLFRTGPNEALNLNLSGAVQVTGHIAYLLET